MIEINKTYNIYRFGIWLGVAICKEVEDIGLCLIDLDNSFTIYNDVEFEEIKDIFGL